MKNKKLFLLPHRCQTAGWIVAGAALAFMAVSFFLGLETVQLFRCQLYGVLFLYLGLFLVGFAREKTEDEFTLHLRTSSALIAMLVICALRILLALVNVILRLNGTLGEDFNDMMKDLVDGFTNFGTVFILYLFLYKVRLARYNREVEDEE